MSGAFFDTQMRKMRLGVAAHEWLGTPFVAHGKIRGAGVDCVHLCAEIYKDCGVWENYEFPKYTLDQGAHMEISKVLAWADASGRFTKAETPQPGDLVVFKFKKVQHHIGLLITTELFLHVLEHRRVETDLIAAPPYKGALTHVYRPMEVVR